jgi:putative restriction endonuclease
VARESDDSTEDAVLARLTVLRQHEHNGRRSPHKPLLVLLALGRLHTTGSSAISWSEARTQLADLIAEFGPASRTSRAQSAAYPFTHLRNDRVWALDHDVPMDRIGPLAKHRVVGRMEQALESLLAQDRALRLSAARAMVDSHFPDTIASDVLTAVGFDPNAVLHAQALVPDPADAERRRAPGWRESVIQAWDRRCAFCGYDGQVGGATVGIDAAHVRWFAFDGPDTLDNGLALCVLHHKLFDRGVLGLDSSMRIHISTAYSARTTAGRAVYQLHGQPIEARPGTPLPATDHVTWHRREVFKGEPITVE